MEAVITYGKFDYSYRNRSEVIVFGPFFYNYITVKMLLFYKIYICKNFTGPFFYTIYVCISPNLPRFRGPGIEALKLYSTRVDRFRKNIYRWK